MSKQGMGLGRSEGLGGRRSPGDQQMQPPLPGAVPAAQGPESAGARVKEAHPVSEAPSYSIFVSVHQNHVCTW